MLPASNRGAGQNLAFPDVCNTPVGPATVPIPYPNIAMNAQATAFSMVVKVSMMNALNMSSVIPMTNGDQAGVAHPTVMGAARYTMGNPIVFVDKQPAICLLCPTTGNNMNAPLGAVLVPSAVNVFYTFAADSAEATWLTDVRQRLETLRQASVTAAVAGDVLLLRVAAFPADVVRRVHVALMGLPLDEVRAVAIDLRGNPGGELSAAVDLAADFLPDGSLVARVVDADGDEEDLRTTRAPRFDLPVTVFVDHDTASAAEVFASALRNAGRGVLVGKPTRGKMTSSTLLTQPDGAGEVTHVLSCISAAGPLVPEVVHAP
jgi:carboxyl-terminal processing protease